MNKQLGQFVALNEQLSQYIFDLSQNPSLSASARLLVIHMLFSAKKAYTRSEIMEVLNCGDHKSRSVVIELTEKNLLEHFIDTDRTHLYKLKTSDKEGGDNV